MARQTRATKRPAGPWRASRVSGLLLLFLTLAAGARPLPARGSVVAQAMDGFYADTGDRERLVALAELALAEAQRVDGRGSEAASGWYLMAAAQAYAYLFGPGHDCRSLAEAPCRRPGEVYRRATSGYLSAISFSGDWRHDHERQVLAASYSVRVDDRAELGELDRVVLAEELAGEGLRNRHRRAGVGVPLVGIRKNRRLSAVKHFYPPSGLARPLTAVLRFESGNAAHRDGDTTSRLAVLSFHDPRRTSTLRIGTAVVPLAADFTAPCAYQATSDWLRDLGRIPFTATEEALAHQGLLLLEAYDPHKTPVLMIHGLRSNPGAWLELTNDLWGDPQLRDDFQVWHYFYPTGLPYLYSASLLRDELAALRLALDPSGTDDALESLVIVAHSMGGLISKALIAESGEAIWEEAIAVSPKELDATAQDIETLRRCFLFDPLPYVDRVVFISTPHRGSARANGFVGRLGAALVRRARALKSTFQRIAANNEALIRPDMRKLLARGGATSIRALSPQYPILRKLADLPIDPGVTVHTIVGDRGLARGKGPRRSDGVVTYASAHLDEAASELVVPARHDAYSHPLAIAEVKRILREHLRSSLGERERHVRVAAVGAMDGSALSYP